MVFLSLKSKPLITADCALSGRSSLCASAPTAAEASCLFVCLCPLGTWSVGCTGGGGGDPSSAPWLLPCLCPGFSREQISRTGDSRSHEKTVADVSLLSNTLWILNLLFFSGGGWLSVCVFAHYLLHMGYTQHWSGVLLIKVAKVHPGKFILARRATTIEDKKVGWKCWCHKDSYVLQARQELHEHILMPLQAQTEDFFFPRLLGGLQN